MAKTTTDLLNSVKRRAQLPDDSGTLSDSDILAFASDELQNVIYPRLMAMNEWHYAFTYTDTVTSAREYRINSRAAGNRIISVEYTSDSVDYRFIRYRHPLTQANTQELAWENYSIYGNKIVLSDGCPTSGTLRIRAVLRPSQLVSSGCQAITSVDVGNSTLNVASSSGFSADQVVDFVYSSSPYELWTTETVFSIPSGTEIKMVGGAIDSTWTAVVAAGIRICPQEQTDRPQLPDELHDYLAQRTAIRCMEARGMTADMNNHLRKLQDLEGAFDRLVAPRNKGEFKAIISEDFAYVGRP